jgi:hypothetical protein
MTPQAEQQLIAVLQQIAHELHRINANLANIPNHLNNIANKTGR